MILQLSDTQLEALISGVLEKLNGFSLPVRHQQKNSLKPPKIGTSGNTKVTGKPFYDTFLKKYDTVTRLYVVGEIYYYRRRHRGKLFRVSLRTKDFRVAMYRRRLFDLIKGEDLFKLTKGDYEIIFEYDSPEEFKELYNAIVRPQIEEGGLISYQPPVETPEKMDDSVENRKRLIKHETRKTREKAKHESDKLTFFDLEILFVDAKQKTGKVGRSTYKQYAATFKKLQSYFKKRQLHTLTVEDFEKFREFLAKKEKVKNKTINNHFVYINSFFEFAINRQMLSYNPVKAIESLKEEKSEKQNFSDDDIKAFMSADFDEKTALFIKIAMYSGMRLHEIHKLEKEDIKQSDDGIYFFDIKSSKTENGVRKVPIHLAVLQEVLEADFPIFPDKTTDAAQKVLNRKLKKVVNEKGKSFHSFRGTFIEKAIEKNPDKIVLIQEIVGHSKSEKDKLTVDTYAKGFSLALKRDVVESVSY